MADLIVYTTTEPYDGYRAQLEAARQAVRDQYGQHRLVHAADGGCRVCPLAAMDPIHVEVAVRTLGRVARDPHFPPARTLSPRARREMEAGRG